MKSLDLNTSYKHHSFVALIISLWLVLFLVLIAPFDAAELSFTIRLKLFPIYGIVTFLSYLILIPVQNLVYKTLRTWNIILEISYIFLYHLATLLGCYLYYKSSMINGTYSFKDFTYTQFYPVFVILLVIFIFSRWFLNKKIINQKSELILLKGDNKLDVLQVAISDLIRISSADNYIEVCYLKDGVVKTKLLRTTLKKIHSIVPSLLKVHRSHLINPLHFKDWKDSTTLHLTMTEVPVSKKYRNAVIAMNHSPQKTNDSSLSQVNK